MIEQTLIEWTKTSLLLIFIIILSTGSMILLLKARKVEFLTTRRVMQGYALFGICFTFTRIFFLLSNYENFVHPPVVIDDVTHYTLMSNIWTVAAYTVTMASIVFVFRVVEHYILNKKPIFAIIAFVSVLVDIVALVFTMLGLTFGTIQAKDLALDVQNIAAPILGVAICVLYIVIIKNSAGAVKRKAAITFVGVLLLLMGILLDMSLFSSIEWFNPIRAILTPIFMTTGVLLVFFSITR